MGVTNGVNGTNGVHAIPAVNGNGVNGTNGHAPLKAKLAELDVRLLHISSHLLTTNTTCLQASKLTITLSETLKPVPPPETLVFGKVSSRPKISRLPRYQILRRSSDEALFPPILTPLSPKCQLIYLFFPLCIDYRR